MNNKCVLISIHPRWIDKIFFGEKTVEIRKNKPKIEPPFKCYVYMTAGSYEWKRDPWTTAVFPDGAQAYDGSQMVVGEFICDRITPVCVNDTLIEHTELQKETCLSEQQLAEYLKGKVGYGWHISDARTYKHPLPVSAFKKPESSVLAKAPQSWCYVEEINERKIA